MFPVHDEEAFNKSKSESSCCSRVGFRPLHHRVCRGNALLERAANERDFVEGQVGIKWKANELRINLGGARAVVRLAAKGITIIRMQMQRHPMNAGPDTRGLEFGDNARSRIAGCRQQADRIKM